MKPNFLLKTPTELQILDQLHDGITPDCERKHLLNVLYEYYLDEGEVKLAEHCIELTACGRRLPLESAKSIICHDRWVKDREKQLLELRRRYAYYVLRNHPRDITNLYENNVFYCNLLSVMASSRFKEKHGRFQDLRRGTSQAETDRLAIESQ